MIVEQSMVSNQAKLRVSGCFGLTLSMHVVATNLLRSGYQPAAEIFFFFWKQKKLLAGTKEEIYSSSIYCFLLLATKIRPFSDLRCLFKQNTLLTPLMKLLRGVKPKTEQICEVTCPWGRCFGKQKLLRGP